MIKMMRSSAPDPWFYSLHYYKKAFFFVEMYKKATLVKVKGRQLISGKATKGVISIAAVGLVINGF